MKTLAIVALALLSSASQAAAQASVTTPPPSIILNNYDSVPVGPYGGLEGSSTVARVGDPSAAWYNPAGLALEGTAQISGSAGVYQHVAVNLQALPNQGGSTEQLPNFVGFTVKPSSRLTLGAAFLTTNSWNQETDSELLTPTAAGAERFSYSGDSDYEQREFAAGAGYKVSDKLRVGGGLAMTIMSMRLVQTVSDRIADNSGLKSLLVASRVIGDAVEMRAQAGVQYDAAPHWRLGAAIRTPGVTLYKSATITLDGVLDAGASSQGASVFDPNAAFAYHLPWEFQGGVALVGNRAQLEVDVAGYSAISAYSMVATAQPSVTYGDNGTGNAPSIVTRPFPGLTSASNAVVNVSAGGHYLLFKERTLRLHGSVGTNESPVNSADNIFTKSDLLSWTLGLSGSIKKFQFSAGLNTKTGNADSIVLRNLLSGQPVTTAINVRTFGFIYSLAYQF